MTDAGTLHIVDACVDIETVKRIEIASPQSSKRIESQLAEIAQLSRCHSTHHLDLRGVIELAHALGKLPSRVVLWAVPSLHFAAEQPLSERCERAIGRCAERLLEEIQLG